MELVVTAANDPYLLESLEVFEANEAFSLVGGVAPSSFLDFLDLV